MYGVYGERGARPGGEETAMFRMMPANRSEAVAAVGDILRAPSVSESDFNFAMAMMVRYVITANELNR